MLLYLPLFYTMLIIVPLWVSSGDGNVHTLLANQDDLFRFFWPVLIGSFLYILCQYQLVKDGALISEKYKWFMIILSVIIFLALVISIFFLPVPEVVSGKPNEKIGLLCIPFTLIAYPFIIIPIAVIQKSIFFVIGYTKTKNIADKSNLSMIPARLFGVALGGTVLFLIIEFVVAASLQLDIGNAYTEHIALSCEGAVKRSWSENRDNVIFSLTIDSENYPYHQKRIEIKSSPFSEAFYFISSIKYTHDNSFQNDLEMDDHYIKALETMKNSSASTSFEFDRLNGQFKYTKLLEYDKKSETQVIDINGTCKKVRPI